GGGGPTNHQDVDLEPEKLGREIGEPLAHTVRIAILDDDVLALTVAKLTQPLLECGEKGIGRRKLPDDSDPGDLPRRLRLGGRRRGEQDDDDHERDPGDHPAATTILVRRRAPNVGWR